MKKKRFLSLVMALCLMFGSAAALPEGLFADSASVTASASESTGVETVTASHSYSSEEKIDSSVKHAYDPMTEIEKKKAEEELRKSAEIVDKTVLFTIKEKHAANTRTVYLTDDSQLCKDNGLKKVEMLLETKAENEDDTYETFYQAVVSTDDVWSVVDKLKEDSRVSNAEPDFVWKDSAVGGYKEVTREERNTKKKRILQGLM